MGDGSLELRRLWGAFWNSRVLLTANNLGFFEELGEYRDAADLAERLDCTVRGTELLLDALTGLGLVTKRGHRYRNAATANRFLVRGKPHYLGDIIRHADTLWHKWSELDQIVRSGTRSNPAHNHEAFIRGMHNLASFKAPGVLRAIGLKGVKRALDLGGGPGTYSMAMAAKGIAVTLMDLPETVAIARQVVSEADSKGIEFRCGSLFIDDLGNDYDLILISQVLHSFSEEENRQTITKCRKSLRPGGRLAIHEFLIDDSRTWPASSALFSVNMLVGTNGGRCYSPAEMERWLREAGFTSLTSSQVDDTVVVTGGIR